MPGLGQSLVEQLAGRTYERPPCEIFMIARLLADEYDWRVFRTFAEHGLSGRFVERAALADARL